MKPLAPASKSPSLVVMGNCSSCRYFQQIGANIKRLAAIIDGLKLNSKNIHNANLSAALLDGQASSYQSLLELLEQEVAALNSMLRFSNPASEVPHVEN